MAQTLTLLVLAGAGFIEISQIARAVFGAKAYYAFGFLSLAATMVGLTAALTTVLFTYFHLCAEDYRSVAALLVLADSRVQDADLSRLTLCRWHWRSFLTGGGSAFYVFLYGLGYWASRLHLPGFANKVLYLGYLALVSGLTFMVTGTVGFAASWAFLRVI